MKYLLISDIHGCKPTLEKALAFYKQQHCDMLLILGDILNYGPRNRIPQGIDAKGIVDLLNPLADQIIAIRGNCDAEVDQMLLNFPIMADYALIVDNGKKLFLTHGHKYTPENLPPGHFHAVFSGHTHLWNLSQKEETCFCNIGSITFPKEGNPPTFATYEDGTVKVFTLEGILLAQLSI